METMTQLQTQIVTALIQLSGKDLITEANLAKKIRENAKLHGKTKAGIDLKNMETALEEIAAQNIFYALHLNSANEFLLKKDTEYKPLEQEARHRRIKSEKSMCIFTNGDFKPKGNADRKDKRPKQKRTDRKSLNIYSNFEEE